MKRDVFCNHYFGAGAQLRTVRVGKNAGPVRIAKNLPNNVRCRQEQCFYHCPDACAGRRPPRKRTRGLPVRLSLRRACAAFEQSYSQRLHDFNMISIDCGVFALHDCRAPDRRFRLRAGMFETALPTSALRCLCAAPDVALGESSSGGSEHFQILKLLCWLHRQGVGSRGARRLHSRCRRGPITAAAPCMGAVTLWMSAATL